MTGLRAILLASALALVGIRPSLAEEVGQAGPSPEIPLERTAQRLGLEVSRDAPITITADELDVVRNESGQERVIFRRNVSVVQGELRLKCDWLEAEYPDGAGGQARRIVAHGAVRMLQNDSEVRCTQAVFDNDACTAVCTSSNGSAELRRGENVIQGDQIVFNLCTGHLKVRGRARVEIKPEEEGS